MIQHLTPDTRGDNLAAVLVLLGPLAVTRLAEQADDFIAGAGAYARARLATRKETRTC